jgi:hypothetical protein
MTLSLPTVMVTPDETLTGFLPIRLMFFVLMFF